jgi:acyl-CoA synthetase (NDP forming)
MVASTLPELLDDAAAWRFAQEGVPAVAGLRTGLVCALALGRPPADVARLREVAAVCGASGEPGEWLSEHDAKTLLRERGVTAVEGVLANSEEAALDAFHRLGGHVALKVSSPDVRHKSELLALELDVVTADAVRIGYRRLAAMGDVIVERMAEPGIELLVAARRDAVVPALVLALGGVWTELLDDVAIVPLPASPARIERALRSLRAAPLLTGGRGTKALDVAAAAQLAHATGEALLSLDAELIELNPVLVHERGATAVDATMRLRAAAPLPAAPLRQQ